MGASGLPVAFKLNLRAVKFRGKITYHLYGTQVKPAGYLNVQQNKSVGLLVILTCFPSEKRHLQCLLIPLNKGLVFSRENLSLSI